MPAFFKFPFLLVFVCYTQLFCSTYSHNRMTVRTEVSPLGKVHAHHSVASSLDQTLSLQEFRACSTRMLFLQEFWTISQGILQNNECL